MEMKMIENELLPVSYYCGELKNQKALGQWAKIFLERRDYEKDSWVIVKFGFVYTREGEWEYEPMPSSRNEEFLKRSRFTFEEAKEIIKEIMKKNNGRAE